MNKNEQEEKQKEEYDSNNIANCSCLTKTPTWEYHRKYCAVWKNGRITQLESEIQSMIDDWENSSMLFINTFSERSDRLKQLLEKK